MVSNNFWLVDVNWKEEFYKLPYCWDQQKGYLTSRGIDYEKVKWLLMDSNWSIAMLVYEDDFAEWIVKRKITNDGQRFSCQKGTNGKAIYQWKYDTKKDYIFIVEGMFDFLSIYQYDTNVIWMRTCELGIHEVQRIARKFEKVYYIPDNDEAWKASIKSFDKLEPYIFSLNPFQVKDVNDLVKIKGNILQEIKDSSVRKSDIFTWRIAPFSWWLDKVDNKFWVLDQLDLVVIAWFPSMWKTEYSFFCARENAKAWNKTVYYTLELKPRFMKTRIAMKKAWISKIEFQKARYTDQQSEKANQVYKELSNIENLLLTWFEESPNIEKIIEDIREKHSKGYNLFFIDNLWNISWIINEVERYNEITQQLQQLKNQLDICIVLLHHMSKPSGIWWVNRPGWIAKLRSSQKIVDNSTLILEVWRDTDPDEESEKVRKTTKLCLYKDTFAWLIWTIDIYFINWTYVWDRKK